MILESADTAFFFGHSGQDAVMGCELCGRRIETSHARMVDDRELCHRCTRAYNIGFIDGKWAGIRMEKEERRRKEMME